jgi:hypothetical protein
MCVYTWCYCGCRVYEDGSRCCCPECLGKAAPVWTWRDSTICDSSLVREPVVQCLKKPRPATLFFYGPGRIGKTGCVIHVIGSAEALIDIVPVLAISCLWKPRYIDSGWVVTVNSDAYEISRPLADSASSNKTLGSHQVGDVQGYPKST